MGKRNDLSRRNFIKNASVGIVGVGVTPSPFLKQADEISRLPREVWVASVTLDGLDGQTVEERIKSLVQRMDELIHYQPDIICLSESIDATGVSNALPLRERAEVPPGPVTGVFAEYAKKHNCYIICPIATKQDGKYYNAAVVIDRNGGIVGEYRKIRPTVGEMKGGITPGHKIPPVFKTDFGIIGIQVCFDLNWHDQWRELKEAGAEIVFYSSQYCGGRLLNAEAWMNKYYVVSSSRRNPSVVIDISGDELYRSESHDTWVCGPINLDKEVIGRWPHITKLNEIRKKYGRKISFTVLTDDARIICESRSPDVRVADVLREFGIELMEERIKKAEKVYEKYW
jgi:predicted amidohydrolase